jgi:2'-5' RNA ligase
MFLGRNMSIIRAFIAVNISPEILSRIKDVADEMQQSIEGVPVRWVPIENIHLTLKFLGDVSISNLEYLKKILSLAGKTHRACEISVGGLGAYPNSHRPRVLWIGMKAPQALMLLQHTLEVETEKLGYDREGRPFSPHLTIGRVSRNATGRDIHRLATLLEELKVGFLGVAIAGQVHLYQSDLGSKGAKYSCLFTVPLLAEPANNY